MSGKRWIEIVDFCGECDKERDDRDEKTSSKVPGYQCFMSSVFLLLFLWYRDGVASHS